MESLGFSLKTKVISNPKPRTPDVRHVDSPFGGFGLVLSSEPLPKCTSFFEKPKTMVTVTGLWTYPVKSCRPIELRKARLWTTGDDLRQSNVGLESVWFGLVRFVWFQVQSYEILVAWHCMQSVTLPSTCRKTCPFAYDVWLTRDVMP